MHTSDSSESPSAEQRGLSLGLSLLREARDKGMEVSMYAGGVAVWQCERDWALARRIQRHEFEVLAALQRFPTPRPEWNSSAGDHDLPYQFDEAALHGMFSLDGLARLQAMRDMRSAELEEQRPAAE